MFGQTGLCKLCRPRSDAAECSIWSGSTQFANHLAIFQMDDPLSYWINQVIALPTSNFQPIRLLDPGCWYKFTYLMANSADPDQLARSQLIWIYNVCKDRVDPGSAGQGLRVTELTCLNVKSMVRRHGVWILKVNTVCGQFNLYNQSDHDLHTLTDTAE